MGSTVEGDRACYDARGQRITILGCLIVSSAMAGCQGEVVGVDAGSDAGSDSGTVAGDTWDSWGQGFFTMYCTECHNSAVPRDYRTVDPVRRDSATIRCGTSAVAESGCGSFPPPSQFPVGAGPRPPDTERARLILWIDDGQP